jgi:lysophospholipase L1-like esterase
VRVLIVVALASVLALPASADAAKTRYYVSLGDSYAQGWQPNGPNGALQPTSQSYTDYFFRKARRAIPGLKHVKIGCGGATTDSMINGTKGCAEPDLPYESSSPDTSQLKEAARFLRAKRKRVAVVTVIIGGNDIAPCARAGDTGQIIVCVSEGIEEIKENLPVIARTLRSAAGPKAVMIGSTYPDVVLGEWIRGDSGRDLAAASVDIFREQVNPALRSAYRRRDIRFVDATAKFGGYIPLERTTTLAPYGEIPVAVARVCTFGWYCENSDIHLRASGYARLGNLHYTQLKRALR